MTKRSKTSNTRIYMIAGGVFLLLCAVVGVAAWMAVRTPVFASMMNPAPPLSAPESLWANQVEIAKPISQGEILPVAQAVESAVPTKEAAEPSVPEPTQTLVPTSIPTEAPTFTPAPTLTPEATETPGELAMEVLPNTPTLEYVPPPTYDAPVYASSGNGARWIDVDLTNQRVYAYEGDVVINSFIVSTGTWLTPTVTGKYKIYVKIASGNMHGPGYSLKDVPYIMYFYKGYGFHGTYWHNNFGTPMSHGCVNLRTDEAGWLFDFASVGTVVNIHY